MKGKVVDYKVCEANSSEGLEQQVVLLLESDYELYGDLKMVAVFASHDDEAQLFHIYSQAMVQRASEEDED